MQKARIKLASTDINKINEVCGYIKDVAFQEPPYTTSTEFMTYIRAVTPDSLQYLVTDMFESIVLYSNKVDSASYEKLDDGRYRVDMVVSCGKYRPYAAGAQNEEFKAESNDMEVALIIAGLKEEDMDTLQIADWIDVGIFTEVDGEDKELYLKKHKIDKAQMKLSVIVDQKPVEVGIDPYNKLIDRKSDDNRLEL